MSDFTPDAPLVDAPEYESYNLLNTITDGSFQTEQDLISYSMSYAQSLLPEWEPNEGDTEVVLLQSLAIMLAPQMLSLSLVPSQVVDQLLALMGMRRDPGAPVTGKVSIEVTNSNPTQTVPAGTRMRLELPDTGESVDFTTDEQLDIITSDATTGVVAITATTLGTTGNNTPTGQALELLDALPFVSVIRTYTQLTGGRDEEQDAEFQSRAAAMFESRATTLVTPNSFKYTALTHPEVGRVTVLDRYDPADPSAVSTGFVTLAVAAKDGTALVSYVKSALKTAIEAEALSSLTISVIDPTYTTVNISISVTAAPGYPVDQVKTNIEDMIKAWISPKNWDWSPQITHNGMVTKVGNVQGVGEVTSVPDTIQLTQPAPLPILGTLTVTVTASTGA